MIIYIRYMTSVNKFDIKIKQVYRGKIAASYKTALNYKQTTQNKHERNLIKINLNWVLLKEFSAKDRERKSCISMQ